MSLRNRDGEGTGAEGFRPTGHQIISAALITIVVIFGLVNLEDVRIDLIVGDVTLPRVFVILVSMVLGVIAGALLRYRRSRDD